jgi:hypothetical protein
MKQDNNNKRKSGSHKNLFFYRIDQLRILIEDDIKMEVLSESNIYPIPHAPAWYLGTSSVRGTILPVINIHFLLGIDTPSPLQKQWLLKLEHPLFSPIIVAMDSLPSQMNLNTLSSFPADTNIHYPHWVESSALQNNHTFLFADHYTLFEALINNDQDKLILSNLKYFHKNK